MHHRTEENNINTGINIIKKPMRWLGFVLLAVLTGAIAGLGAVVFRGLIALVHNLIFLGTFSFAYDANVHTQAGPWGAFVIAGPVLGSLIVTFIIERFAPEAKGHGVPEVMEAVYHGGAFIRPVVAVFKSIASALSIGTGGSVGREGPIAQIGSAFGSTLGQVLPMTIKQRITLIAAGAGGGIAATFNTPIGGMLFAVELLLHEVSVSTLVPVAVATATATYIGRLFFGVHPSFVIPEFQNPYFHALSPWLLIPYAVLGMVMGLASTLFIHSLYAAENFFEKRLKGPYIRHAAGMLIVGLIMYILLITTGHYHVEGVGYATVQNILTGDLPVAGLLLLLFFLKLLAFDVTLGSGGSGGIFSPALFLGATLGGAFGLFFKFLLPHAPVNPAAFAVAGMAGMVGGATGAAMTAIVMIFEMTLNYSVVLPMTLTVALSYGVRALLTRDSIYTLKLRRRGHFVPDSLRVNLMHMRPAADLMQKQVVTVSASDSLDTLASLSREHPDVRWFLVVSDGRIEGVALNEYCLPAEEIEQRGRHSVADVMRRDFVFGGEDEMIDAIIARLHRSHATVSVMMRKAAAGNQAAGATGIITWEQIVEAIEESVEMFSEAGE